MQIKDLSIFHNLDDAEFKKSLVCTQSVIHEYKKNDYIFFQGDVPNKLYLILNGEVELGSINVNGKVLRITNISEGEDFGEVELFLNKDRYSGYAKAKTDVKLLEIAKDFFGGRCEKNCSHHSKVVFNMLELFAKRTDENNQQLEVLTSGNLKQRIATYLLEHADNNNLVSLSMNREELALYLNTTRPSLSRTLLSLQEDGFIHLSSRKSIKILDERGDIDVIIVGRGGGSLEDLWAFNTEQVARAVFDCNTPVISAVGHETDYTICDFVSDLRAPTPSAAAELAVPDSNVLIDFLDNANKRLSALLNDRIEREYQKLDNLMLSSFMAEPGEYFSQKIDEVDVLYARLKDGFSYLVEKENSKFSNLVSSLDALSPLKVLARGYSITTKNEKVIRDIKDINIDDELKVKLSKGYTKCVVKEVVSDE